jgi:5-formyltetrahydrofolate cyclo-ligase
MELTANIKNKSELRKQALKIRAEADISDISFKISNLLIGHDFYKDSKNILAYYPFGSEIDLRKCFEDNSKNWFLPRVNGKNLDIYKYTTGDKLEKSPYRVFEPFNTAKTTNPEIIDLAVIPALMVDLMGYRLGYGAGFYDRFISNLRKDCAKIVPVIDRLVVKELPADKWDIPADCVVTEKKIFFTKIN